MARDFTNSTNQIETDMTDTTATDRTYAGWLYKDGNGGGNSGRWFHKGGSNAIEHGSTQSSGAMQFRRRFATTVGVWVTDGAMPASSWFHACITMDNASASNDPSIYFDGGSAEAITESTTPAGGPTANSTALAYGNAPTLGTRGWDGRQAHHGIWNRILRGDEIDFLAAGGDPRHLPNSLISYHALNEDLQDTR